MADNAKPVSGTVHVMEEEMRAAGVGVFEETSTEAGAKRRSRAKAAAAPKNKAEPAPKNKSA